MKTVFGTLDAQDVRAIFLEGTRRGSIPQRTGEKVFSFRLGEDVSSQKEQVYREDRKAAGAEVPGVVKATGSEGIEQYAITYKFVEKYMCQKVWRSVFYCLLYGNGRWNENGTYDSG